MPGTRGGIARMIAMGVALALALLLLAAREATAGDYRVAQCGWNIDADAAWADNTGGASFGYEHGCGFGTERLKSFTQGGGAVSGTRFARWRWEAPAGAGIRRVWGTWWQALHDGMEERFGADDGVGGFDAALTASATDMRQREFFTEFRIPAPAIEDRLLCARAIDRSCSLDPGSWSAISSLTIDVFDGVAPVPGDPGGELAAAGWRRGEQSVDYWDSDTGGGVRFSETLLDGDRVGLTEYRCAEAMIYGEWRATRMRPCPLGAAGQIELQTRSFSDGPHSLARCATDFAGNSACLPATTVLIDNSPPTHPRNLALAGGDSWRRVDDFDVTWTNPDQGNASPIAGAYWRITGPSGYDTGVRYAAGRGLSTLADRTLPGPGVYSLRLWLRDEAGNSDPGTAVELPLRLDDVPPHVAFEPLDERAGGELRHAVSAAVRDEHSGPAGGAIFYRRADAEGWTRLPTMLEGGAGAERLVAPVPEELEPGVYFLRAEARDAAGNSAVTTRRDDGGEMALRKLPPPIALSPPPPAPPPAGRRRPKARTSLSASLRWRRRRGRRVTVPFGAGALLSGRLSRADGSGLAGRRLRVVSRPSHGALMRRRVATVRTGRHGGFRLALPAGPSRRVTVAYRGGPGLARARRPGLALRVRSAVTLSAAPRSLRTGHSLRLWGRVRARGAPLPRRGKLVAIQYYENEARVWRPILVTRSDHSGRFHARYRFRYISGTARIRLRAVVLAEERWPYAPGASRPVLVKVTG
ncbi:MAG TPA: carboxypeptidase-like regulatory domain-containing protein [Solirubrobacterales bacterium]|nr:carboxypeptidase-like regulatory domain-containing protein [Solirubrobacterales bacterium]